MQHQPSVLANCKLQLQATLDVLISILFLSVTDIIGNMMTQRGMFRYFTFPSSSPSPSPLLYLHPLLLSSPLLLLSLSFHPFLSPLPLLIPLFKVCVCTCRRHTLAHSNAHILKAVSHCRPWPASGFVISLFV